MKNNRLQKNLWAALVFFSVTFSSMGQELAKGEKATIFIGRLKIQPSVEALAKKSGREHELKRVAESLETQFIHALNATRVFQIVERRRFTDIHEEQNFALSGMVENDKNAAQIGKMAGAKYAFLPQIDGFEDRSETPQYQQIGRSSMYRKLFLSVVVQVVDTTTGKVLPDSPSVQLNKTESFEMTRMGAGAPGGDQILVELAKEMASKLSQGVVSLLRPAKVLTVTGQQILINRGTEAGFNKGDLVEIYAFEEVKDEDTGETFRNEIPVGQARIVRTDAKQSFAVIEGDDPGISKGCVVKVIQPANVPESKPSGALTPGSSDKPLKFE